MATNKRKDAAALFELIDRSTLKVPKNAGSLKIPAWWSSKTNPPTSPTAPSRPRPLPAAIPPTQPKAPATPSVPDPTIPEPEPAQARLFEPPPPDVTPATTPSFRPPTSPTVPAASHERVETPAELAEPPAESQTPDNTIAPQATSPTPRPLPKVFAPQTYARERKPWSPPRPGAFARLPAWVILSAIVGAVVLVSLVVYAAKKSGSSTDATTLPPHTTPPTTGAATGLVPAPSPGTIERPLPTGTATIPSPLPPQNAAAPGHILEAGTYPYVKEKFYVIVCSTPERAIALRNAAWLTEKGIDVAIEGTRLQNRIMYTLVATRSFASATAAESFRQEIVRIGDAHIKDAKDAFKTAYARSGLTSPQPARTQAPKG